CLFLCLLCVVGVCCVCLVVGVLLEVLGGGCWCVVGVWWLLAVLPPSAPPAVSGRGPHVRAGGPGAHLLGGGRGEAPRDGVLGGVLQRTGQPQDLGLGDDLRGPDCEQGPPAGGDGAGLGQLARVAPAGG
ncbi:hypothetical protein PUR61_19265, partial [Streptomyces sp. BE20]|nr:hypothetical protein [Streptomyces sp. BE20]